MSPPAVAAAVLGLLIAAGAGLCGVVAGGVTAGDWLVSGLLLIVIGGLIHVAMRMDERQA